ncbi:imelysin family protein [Puniceibacterium sp. IMCC21224]|uniref:imelysin family protein n=1 Tax=Puniceibacterium sp. IMCC21224 TaxID=1618204 RepID=UPI00064DE85D|nr:imelysin family protein [Puniceibacterium sp. IMCC21224]KMK65218.1 putative periplasmic lipoprotein [Puniceibacterium sp. IMCC21224]
MRISLCIAAFAFLAGPALSDVDRVIDQHILPGYASFAHETKLLTDTASGCDLPSLRVAWNDSFDAWLGVSHLNFGPVESQGRAVIIAFWPDGRGATPRSLAGLIADKDPIIGTAEGTAQISVAARGLFALEFLLYDPQFMPSEGASESYTCQLIAALSSDLAVLAASLESEWRGGYGKELRTAGETGNQTFLSLREARQRLYTALMTGLEFNADQRLGRPLGTFDRPRPERAEARRAGRSQRNVALSLAAMHTLATALSDAPIPVTDAAFERAIMLTDRLDDPDFAAANTMQGRFELEALQQAVRSVSNAVQGEIGVALGVSAGFNSADGD